MLLSDPKSFYNDLGLDSVQMASRGEDTLQIKRNFARNKKHFQSLHTRVAQKKLSPVKFHDKGQKKA